MVSIKKLFILLLCFGSQVVLGQSIGELALSSQSKGDKYFDQFAYKKAISFYEESLLKQDNDSIKGELAVKIASSYTKLNEPELAIKWYATAQKENIDLEAESLLNYAQALASSNKYAQATEIFKRLSQEEEISSRIKEIATEQLNAIEKQSKFFKNTANVQIEKAPFNSPYSDFSPLIFDSLILFVSARSERIFINSLFNWDESNYLDIYSYNASSGEVKPFSSNINTKLHEGPLTSYNNNKEIIFTRNTELTTKTNANGITKLQLFYALNKEGKWSKGAPLSFNHPNFSFAHPSITEDGNTLYFASDLPGGMGGTDLYRVERNSKGEWGNPQNLEAPINSPGDEFFPSIHGDRIYFASNGHGGLGGLDLFAYDLSKGKNGKVVNLGAPINSSLDDFAMAVNPDGLSGYFSSNREESAFKDEIYSFVTDRDLMPQYKLKVLLTDRLSGEQIKGANLYLLSNENDTLSLLQPEDKFYFTSTVEVNKSYRIIAMKDGYLTNQKEFTSIESNAIESVQWQTTIDLEKEYDFGFKAFVFDSESVERLDSVHVNIINNLSDDQDLDIYSNGEGQFQLFFQDKKLDDRVSYQIKLEKDGYLGKSFTYNSTLEQPGLDNLNNSFDLGLDKIEVGADIGKLIDVQPIYFDLGKSTIREDAAKELDKIVAVMKDNPNMTIELGSHTDSRGSDAFNLKLSDKRAKASAAYIVSQGIDESRIIGKGYGETQLINDCGNGVKCSEEKHQLNRRTEFKVLDL